MKEPETHGRGSGAQDGAAPIARQPVDVKATLERLPRAQTCRRDVVSAETVEQGSEGPPITRREQPAVEAIGDDLAQSSAVAGDHRPAVGHGLDRYQPERLRVVRGDDQYVGVVDIGRDISDFAHDLDRPRVAEPRDSLGYVEPVSARRRSTEHHQSARVTRDVPRLQQGAVALPSVPATGHHELERTGAAVEEIDVARVFGAVEDNRGPAAQVLGHRLLDGLGDRHQVVTGAPEVTEHGALAAGPNLLQVAGNPRHARSTGRRSPKKSSTSSEVHMFRTDRSQLSPEQAAAHSEPSQAARVLVGAAKDGQVQVSHPHAVLLKNGAQAELGMGEVLRQPHLDAVESGKRLQEATQHSVGAVAFVRRVHENQVSHEVGNPNNGRLAAGRARRVAGGLALAVLLLGATACGNDTDPQPRAAADSTSEGARPTQAAETATRTPSSKADGPKSDKSGSDKAKKSSGDRSSAPSPSDSASTAPASTTAPSRSTSNGSGGPSSGGPSSGGPSSGGPTPELPKSVTQIKRPGSPATPTVTAEPQDFTEAVVYPDGISLKVTEVVEGRQSGEGPGAISGPTSAFYLTIRNGGTEPLKADVVVVTAVYGDSGLIARPVYDQRSSDFADTIEPGGSAKAVYTFAFPAADRDQVTIHIDFDGAHTAAVFSGNSTSTP